MAFTYLNLSLSVSNKIRTTTAHHLQTYVKVELINRNIEEMIAV